MGSKLRLLCTKKCDRSCEGCCNKEWDLDHLPVATMKEIDAAPEVLITGGEPMLFPDKVSNIADYIRAVSPDTKVYMYTAKVNDFVEFCRVLRHLDGVCLTLHERKDMDDFLKLDMILHYEKARLHNKSLRLNVFKGVDYYPDEDIKVDFSLCNMPWIVKKDMEWIRNCPLPKGEIFRQNIMLW